MLHVKPKYHARKERVSLGYVILLFGHSKLTENSCSNFLNLHLPSKNTLGVVFMALGLGFRAGEFAFESALLLTGCISWGK